MTSGFALSPIRADFSDGIVRVVEDSNEATNFTCASRSLVRRGDARSDAKT
jgi:hypothetical protein